MTVMDGAALDINDVLGESEFACDSKRNGRKGLVDFNPFDIANRPSGPLQCLSNGGKGPMPNMPGSLRQHHRRRDFCPGPPAGAPHGLVLVSISSPPGVELDQPTTDYAGSMSCRHS